MNSNNNILRDRYFDWLSTQVSPAQLSELYMVYADIEGFCLERNVIKKKLFELTSLAEVRKVMETVDSNKAFRFIYKRQFNKMSSAIHFYYRFAKAHPDFLTQAYMFEESTDDASQMKTDETQAQPVDEARIKEPLPESIEETRKKAFSDWMLSQSVTDSDSRQYVSDLERCGIYAEKWQYIDCSIFLLENINDLISLRDKLILVADIISQRNKMNPNDVFPAYRYALNKYIEFRESAEKPIPVTAQLLQQEQTPLLQQMPAANIEIQEESHFEQPVAIEDQAVPDVPAKPVSEVSVLLSDEQYAPLRIELEAQNIDTIEKLRAIRLWSFMNRQGLYSIAMRQKIQLEVQALLDGLNQEKQQPVILHCGTITYNGEDACHTYLRFCEDMAHKYPLRIRSLLGKCPSSSCPVAIHRYDHFGNSLKMENPTAYINPNLTDDEILESVRWVCDRCGEVHGEVFLENVNRLEQSQPSAEATVELEEPGLTAENQETEQDGQVLADQNNRASQAPQSTINAAVKTEEPASQKRQISVWEKRQIERMEPIVLRADLDGISYDDLRDELDLTMVATKRYASLSDKLVEVKGRLYHKDAFVDWEDGADQLCEIIEKLMLKNNGYISSAQLYGYARTEMNMFLNDNDMNDERAVFDIAQHLFEKVGYKGKYYTFTGKTHISTVKEAIGSNFDLVCKFAEDQGGVFQYDDLADYCTRLKVKTSNLRGMMKLASAPDFFYYTENVIISAKSMKIDDAWLEQVRAALSRLFAGVGDHIILREIQPFWYEQLPILPGCRPWTPLLLQYVLKFYGKKLGARTILAMDSQANDTIHTMLVSANSPIQNFGDVVVTWLIDNEIEQRSFEAEELRQLLIGAHIIQGNELIWNMPKALGRDGRFAWDANGANVTIRV